LDGDIDLDINIDDVALSKKESANQKRPADSDAKKHDADPLLGDKSDNDGQKSSNDEPADKTRRGPKIGEDVQVKICDMGNGCWTYHHFTPEI